MRKPPAPDDRHVTRRAFLQYSAAGAATAGAYGIFLKTDALAVDVPVPTSGPGRGNGQEDFPYGYVDPPGS